MTRPAEKNHLYLEVNTFVVWCAWLLSDMGIYENILLKVILLILNLNFFVNKDNERDEFTNSRIK